MVPASKLATSKKPIPDDGLVGSDGRSVQLDGLGTAVPEPWDRPLSVPSALTFSMVSMDWSSSLDKDLHDTMQTQSNLRDILQGYGSLQGYGRSQAAHQQRTDGAGQEGDASPAGEKHSAEEAR